MKISFIFSEVNDIEELHPANHLEVAITIKDDATDADKHRQIILELSQLIGNLTKAAVFVSCTAANLRRQVVKRVDTSAKLRMSPEVTVIWFRGTIQGKRRLQNRKLRIPYPIDPPISKSTIRMFQQTGSEVTTNLLLDVERYDNHVEQEYIRCVSRIIDNYILLLQVTPFDRWKCHKFNPVFYDNSLVKPINKKWRKHEKQQQEKREPTPRKPHADTGAGRVGGAVPGVFMGVQMRSQLEIRLAAELEERNIEWVYERERLGEGNYLVDFHLPKLGCWIEVKGKVEPRDKFLLKDVAHYLKEQRGERLFMYTSRSGYQITADGFGKSMKHKEFWTSIINLKDGQSDT